MSAPSSPALAVFRPSPEARRRTITYGLLPVLPLLFVSVTNMLISPPTSWIWALALLVIIALLAPYLVWWARITRFEFGGGVYRYVTTFVRREFTVADVARVIAVDEVHYGLNGGRMLFVEGRVRRRLFRMNSVAWDTAQLEAIITDLIGHGVPLTHIQGRLTPGELAQREPGILSWPESHRVAFTLLVVFGVLLLMVVLFVAIIVIFVES
jgi:hypothetical protein